MRLFTRISNRVLPWFCASSFLFTLSAAAAQQVGGEFESLQEYHGSASSMLLGSAVSCAGDVNNDGFDDILIGANLASMNGSDQSGSAFVYSGTDGQQLYRFDGATAYFGLGNEVSGIGDINADGFDDILIGAANSSLTLNQSGSAFVYSGATGNVIFQYEGSAANENFGRSVSGAGDVNADGTPDFIIGAFHASPNNRYQAGSAFVYSGATGLLLYSFDGPSARDYFGCSVSGAGDVNADGYADVISGWPRRR